MPAKVYNLALVYSGGAPLWTAHPDKEVDVAIVGINAKLLRDHGIEFNYFRSDLNLLGKVQAQTEGLTEGDGVFVLGFPLGDPGGQRNYVVVRDGVVARVRDYLSGAGKSFVIDASVFPGNSGDPVITRPEAMAISETKAISSAFLIGVISAYVPYQDVAISQQTNRPRVIFEENSGLAVVVPIDYVTEVVQLAERARAGTPSPAAKA